MNGLEVFTYGGSRVRTVLIDGIAWFVAADVAAVLGLSNSRSSLALLDDDEKDVHAVDTLGGPQQVAVVNEPGLYSLILRSRRPEARAFKRWITHEVLPQIRQTGQFGSALPTSFAEALELAAAEARKVEALESRVAEDAPKVAAYEQLIDSEGFYDMASAAQLGGIGRTTLFNRLRAAGVIQRHSRLPMQRYAHWFKVTTAPYERNGVHMKSQTTRVRPTHLTKVLAKAGIAVGVPA